MLVKPSQIWSNLVKLGQTCYKLVLFGASHYNNNNKMEKNQAKGGRERASGGESVGERILILIFLFSSFLSQIYENRTAGFRWD